MDNTIGSDAGETVAFGTNGTATSPNTFIINDNSAGFGGKSPASARTTSSTSTPPAFPTLGSGDGIGLSYTNGVLTVSETNASGVTLDSTSLSIAAPAHSPPPPSSPSSARQGLRSKRRPGLRHDLQFQRRPGQQHLLQPEQFRGRVAPGNEISAGEFVTISAGTALVTDGAITDDGTINVGTTFSDAYSLSGTGTFAIQPAGDATLTGGASLTGGIIDAGTLVAAGSFAAPISLTSATSQLTIDGNFTDTSAITGPGTITVDSGVTASLTGGLGVTGEIIDAGTLVAGGSFTAPISLTSTTSQLTISSNFTDTGAITGPGTLTVDTRRHRLAGGRLHAGCDQRFRHAGRAGLAHNADQHGRKQRE